jgi:xylulokinase
MMSPCLIAVDIGTQGTKAALFDESLRSLAGAFEPSRLIEGGPGMVWQEAEDIYNSVITVISRIREQSGVRPSSIAAIGIDSQMAGIMGIGEDGEAITYYDSWLDTRCKDYVALMRERGGRRIVELTGGPVTYTHGPKILWWKEENPGAFRRIAKFVLPHGYVVGKICGLPGAEAIFDYTHLQYSGFADNIRKEWSDELLSLFGIPREKMARIVSPFDVAGRTTGTFAAATGLVPGIPVVAGAGDTAASVFGAGLFEQGTLLDCAGTASVLCGVADSFAPDTKHETMTMMRSPEDGKWYPLAYINGGGLCVRWFRGLCGGKAPLSYAELEEEAGRIGPGSEGLIFIPHFAGRVLPSNPGLKGSFVGLDRKHTRGHLFRAVMEGIAYEYHFYLSVLRDLYPENRFNRLAAIGGGAKSELFVSVKADVLGLDAASYRVGDTALIGSAAIAGKGLGLFKNCRELILNTIAEQKAISYDRKKHERYRPMTRKYLQTLGALEGLSAGEHK